MASLQQELLGLSKAHAEVKEILTTEKEGLAKQKAELEVRNFAGRKALGKGCLSDSVCLCAETPQRKFRLLLALSVFVG